MKSSKYLLVLPIFLILSNLDIFSQNKPAYWEDVQAIKRFDKIYKPEKNPIVFVGSSSIRLWRNSEKIFSKYNVLNRGIGGAVINDIMYYANELIFDYQPRQVVIYVGENDLKHNSVSADTIFENIKKLFALIRQKLPEASIVYISIKPSPARAFAFDKLIKANSLIEAYISKEDKISYVNVCKKMLTSDGKYRPELFVKDHLHMNSKGYKIWKKAIKPYLIK